jgi:hypothetical protein
MAGETGLVDIRRLILSDTFNTWFDTTNQIIDAIDPITVYGIESLTGIQLVNGLSGGNYNGIQYIGLVPAHGIGYYGSGNQVTLNYSGLTDGVGPQIVATGDYYAFTDVSDTTQSPFGTIKRVRASDILPSVVNAPGGATGTITLQGNLTINGQLLVGGANSFIASNDLRIEDRNIEIAFQQAGFLGVTGINAGKYPVPGATAYYYDPTVPSGGSTAGSATVIGIVKSITGPAAGPTAIISIGSLFTRGGPELFTLNGSVRFSGTGSISNGGPTGASFGVVAVFGDGLSLFTVAGPTTEFFSDVLLNGAGFTIKGASGDKTFTWSSGQSSLVSNVPLGVANENLYINSRVFRNNGLTSTDGNDFRFTGTSGNNANTGVIITYDGRGFWEFEQDRVAIGNDQLTIKYATGPNAAVYTVSRITGLTSGQLGIVSSAGGSANMWAAGFNAQFLNGAGATFGTTAYSIPVSDERGRINDKWLEASSNRTKITQSAHGFTSGYAIAFDSSITAYVGANCTTYTAAKSEAIGIVETVIDSNNFVIVTNGYISGITGIDSVGDVYFLSTIDGVLSAVEPAFTNSVRKPMFYSTSVAGGSAAGYVLSHPGQIVGAGETPTDQVYLESVVPIGTIQAYAGSYTSGNYNTTSWLPCDGKAVSYQSYVDLYNVIGNVYYARGLVANTAGASPIITVERDIRELIATDLITVIVETGGISGGTSWDASVFSVEPATSRITLTADTGSPTWASRNIGLGTVVRIYGKVDTARGLSSTFFLPDFRTRTSVGSVTGENQGWLGNSWFPSTGSGNEGIVSAFGIGGGTGATGGGFIATNYLIRAVKTVSAAILTGHHHDDRYIVKNGGSVQTGGGITFAGGPYVFGPNGSTGLYVDTSNRRIGVGTSNPNYAIEAVGSIRLGNNNATEGQTFLSSKYGVAADTLNLLGSQYSSGNTVLAYGLKPKESASGYQSTSGVALRRAALEIGAVDTAPAASGLILRTAPQTAVGNGVDVTMTDTLLVSSGLFTYSGATATFNAAGGTQLRLNTPVSSNDAMELAWWEGTNRSWVLDGGRANGTFAIRDDYQVGTPTRLAIDNTGRVGIGTTTPAQRFVVTDPTITQSASFEVAPLATNRVVLNAYNRNTTAYSDMFIDSETLTIRPDGGIIALYVGSTGNVGIGTNSVPDPNTKLFVAGGLKIGPAPGGSSLTGAFFSHPQFNTSSVVAIAQNITLQPSLFAGYGSPTSVYTIDPGAGISIDAIVQIAPGFVWKII